MMNDFERVSQEVAYQLNKCKILSYWITEDFNNHLKMIEVTDNKGNTKWRYFDKKTGIEQPRGI